MRNNNIHHNGRAGMSILNSDGALVESNTIAYNNPDAVWDWGNYAAGVKIWETEGTVLKGNWVITTMHPVCGRTATTSTRCTQTTQSRTTTQTASSTRSATTQ